MSLMCILTLSFRTTYRSEFLLASLAVVVLEADAILDAADLEDHAGFVLLVAAGLADDQWPESRQVFTVALAAEAVNAWIVNAGHDLRCVVLSQRLEELQCAVCAAV